MSAINQKLTEEFKYTGSVLLERRGEAVARGLLAVLPVSTTARGRDQLLFPGRKHLLQDGLLSVSGDKDEEALWTGNE